MAHDDKTAEEQQDADALAVLATGHGRRLLRGILRTCHIFELSIGGGEASLYSEGERNVGLELKRVIERADPYGYVKLLTEEIDERQSDPGRRQDRRSEDDEH